MAVVVVGRAGERYVAVAAVAVDVDASVLGAYMAYMEGSSCYDCWP
jgi:hypothetical protein